MKVSIVGAGRVGSTTAYCLLERKLVDELSLIDIDGNRARGEAIDLAHCSASFGRRVKIVGSSDYVHTEGSNVIVVTAGIPRKPGDTRLDLIKTNTGILTDIAQKIRAHNRGCIVLTVSNPVDVMTYVVQKTSGFEHPKVFGLGTMIDSLRFSSILSKKLSIPQNEVYAIMLGEHGDSMFPAASRAIIKGRTLESSPILKAKEFQEIADEVKKSAAEVIQLKGPTQYAPAVSIAEVLESIILCENRILPVSVYSKEHGVYISSLARVGASGAFPVDAQLSIEEKALFDASAEVLKKACAETGL
jgi:malate/lactate dehydrogenase